MYRRSSSANTKASFATYLALGSSRTIDSTIYTVSYITTYTKNGRTIDSTTTIYTVPYITIPIRKRVLRQVRVSKKCSYSFYKDLHRGTCFRLQCNLLEASKKRTQYKLFPIGNQVARGRRGSLVLSPRSVYYTYLIFSLTLCTSLPWWSMSFLTSSSWREQSFDGRSSISVPPPLSQRALLEKKYYYYSSRRPPQLPRV